MCGCNMEVQLISIKGHTLAYLSVHTFWFEQTEQTCNLRGRDLPQASHG